MTKDKKINRSSFLKAGATAVLGAAGAAAILPLESSAQQQPTVAHKTAKVVWRMRSIWDKDLPVLGPFNIQFADWVYKMSGGQFKIEIEYESENLGERNSYQLTSDGAVQMCSGTSYSWQDEIHCASAFSSIPFGMNAQQLQSWLIGGEAEGYKLCKEAYAKQNTYPLLAGNTGMQIGGWFNKEINTIDDYKGLKMRIPGYGGEILTEFGAETSNQSYSELKGLLADGSLDAAEWIGPYHDYVLGLHKVSKYCYLKGWQEPGLQMMFAINLDAYKSLPRHLRSILTSASNRMQVMVYSEFGAQNGAYLNKLKNEGVQFREFSAEILDALKQETRKSLDALAQRDEFTNRVFESYFAFEKKIGKWYEYSEKKYHTHIRSLL